MKKNNTPNKSGSTGRDRDNPKSPSRFIDKGVKKAIKMALALNCEVPKYFMFDRKNYYYPDLPKGFQITQNDFPVGTNGYVNIYVNKERS